MTSTTTAWRVSAATVAASLTLSTAWAAPPPIQVSSSVSPPSRVGRLATISGTVSFHTADQTAWSPATLNYPITTGNALWTEPNASAMVEVSGNRIAMDGATEFDIATLDDQSLIGSTPQGEIYLNLHAVQNGDTYTIQTPRGAVQITAVGRYEVVAGDTDHPTTIAVLEGSAQISGTNVSLQVGAGQMASITGATTFQGSVGPVHQDAFLTKMLAQERPAPRSAVAIPPVVTSMTGYQDLGEYGAWQESPQYGTVWYPKVENDWVPYRHGRWSYVAPWGWTWVDESPWGFAPFHYGRWAQVDNRWGWIPSDPGVQAYPRPVYAPALVSWVGIGGAMVGAAVGAALAERSVGWVPLGPNEPYYPPYNRSLNYVRQVNGPSIRNVNTVINQTNIQNHTVVVQNFINRGGATVVPAGVMAQSAPIAAAARPLAPQQFAQAHAEFRSPIAPTATTLGVTPAIARQFNFTPAPRPAVVGPAINQAAFRAGPPHGGPGGFVPALRPAVGGPAGSPQRPGEPIAPGAETPAARPGEPPRPPNALAPGAEPGRPGAPGQLEPARPGVLPELRPATPPGTEPARPPGMTTPPLVRPGEPAHPGGVPGPAAEPGRPAGPAQPEPARPGVLPELRPNTPPGAEPARPPGVPAPALARPGEPPRPGAINAPAVQPRPAEPARPAAPAEGPRPNVAAPPAQPARPEMARPGMPHLDAPPPQVVRPEPARPEPARPEPARPQPVRPEPPHPAAPVAVPHPAAPPPRPIEPPRPAAPPPAPHPAAPPPVAHPPPPHPAGPAPHPGPGPREEHHP